MDERGREEYAELQRVETKILQCSGNSTPLILREPRETFRTIRENPTWSSQTYNTIRTDFVTF